MKFKLRQPLPDPDGPNLTPLIDVVFLLLIFFMVSSTFLEESAIEIRLPEANGKAPQQPPDSITVRIDASGAWQVAQQSISAGDRSALGTALERNLSPTGELLVEADARAPHQSVMTLLDLSSQIGVNSLRFKAQEPQ